MENQKLITKLYRDLFQYLKERYGGPKNFLITLFFIRFTLVIVSKTLLYLAENRNNHDFVNIDKTIDETINETINKEKLTKIQRLKKIVKKIRAGDSTIGITQIANFI